MKTFLCHLVFLLSPLCLAAQTMDQLVNYQFDYGHECSGTTMTCYAETITFYGDGTFIHSTKKVLNFYFEYGRFEIKDGIITTYPDGKGVDVYKGVLDESANRYRPVYGGNEHHEYFSRSYQITYCENKLVLKNIVRNGLHYDSWYNYYLRVPHVNTAYLDSRTWEELRIDEVREESSQDILTKVNYYNPVSQNNIELTVISSDVTNRTLTVRFPGEDKNYILSLSDNKKGLHCLNPDGSIQYFERYY